MIKDPDTIEGGQMLQVKATISAELRGECLERAICYMELCPGNQAAYFFAGAAAVIRLFENTEAFDFEDIQEELNRHDEVVFYLEEARGIKHDD